MQLLRVLREYDTEPAELLSGALFLVLAVVLYNPAVHTFASSPSFRVMAQVGPEESWAVAMFVAGCLKLAGLEMESVTLRRLGALTGTCIWTGIAWCVGSANPAGTGIIIYPAFALTSIWILYRLFSKPVRGHR